ncbi:O-succinylhomoserine sulfhydrylase [Nymphon striatum]|nr:O-succinylhomoserine sulfhydrylase [Nymphon striatum]
MSNEKQNWGPATQMVHGGTMRSSFGETSEAMFLTQGFVYDSAEAAEARFKGEDDGYVYSRYANPTVTMFETRMCMLEGAEAAKATASGMAAVAAAMLCQVKAGDHVVAARCAVSAHAAGLSKHCYQLMAPTNPTLEVIDIAHVVSVAHACGAKVVLDNVFRYAYFSKANGIRR